MRFSRLAEQYTRLERTTKRLEMTQILVDILRDAPPGDVGKLVRLTLGELYPPFVGIELGIAERLVVKAVSFAAGVAEPEVDGLLREHGDLGLAAERACARKAQRPLFTEELTVSGVYDRLERIARAEGAGSQDVKVKILSELLLSASPLEARYAIRAVVGKHRLGVADMTMIDALATLHALPGQGARSVEEMTGEERARFSAAREEIERAYTVSSDLGAVGAALASSGLKGLSSFRLTPGTPVRAMLAERATSAGEILERLGDCLAEYKYDGLRIQAHLTPSRVELFSRRMERLSSQFPDVAGHLRSAFRGNDAIVEGECVVVGEAGEIRPFQEVSHRRGRKHGIQQAVDDYPVSIFLFDLLYLDGADLTSRALADRRALLERAFPPSDRVKTSQADRIGTPDALEAFFARAVADGCEGIICKGLGAESRYRAGARGWQWIKYKRDYRTELADSLDLVVVGAYMGQGKRAGKYGALLMACRNREEARFETICRLGTGFDDAMLAALPEILEPHRRAGPDPALRTSLQADVWFSPALVMEVVGAELTLSPVHTCALGTLDRAAGIAVRFPRLSKLRPDKGPEDATGTDEIVGMYRSRRKQVQQAPEK